MCQAAGKLWNDYWRNLSSQEFIHELAAVTGIPVTGLIQSRQGGTPSDQGTWVHRRVALDLARWCSPATRHDGGGATLLPTHWEWLGKALPSRACGGGIEAAHERSSITCLYLYAK